MNLENNSFQLENEEALVELESLSIEGSNQISELSRQLQSFLNYKKALIRARFSSTLDNPQKVIIKSPFLKCEDKISQLFSQYAKLLRNIDGSIENKIFYLLIKTRTQPNSSEAHLLKKIQLIVNELWKEIHILSEMEINEYPHLLKLVVGVASLLCITSTKLNSVLLDFYKELKLSYLELEQELNGLYNVEKKGQNKEKKIEKRAILTE